MANDYVALANITPNSNVSSITFSSIPQNYRDLFIAIRSEVSNSSGAAFPALRFNSDSGSNYTIVFMSGSGTSTSSQWGTTSSAGFGVALSNGDPGLITCNIFDYSQNNKHKNVIGRSSQPVTWGVSLASVRWGNTAPITSITIFADVGAFGNWTSSSSFALYGIAG